MKKWNKAATAAIVTAFVMTGVIPAQAEEPAKPVKVEAETGSATLEVRKPEVPADAIQEQQAIAKVRELFGGLENFKYADAFYSEEDQQFGEGAVWHISFSTFDRNKPRNYQELRKTGPIDSFYAVIDANTGELLQFQQQNANWLGDEGPSQEVAVRAADLFLNKIVPNLRAKLTSGELSGGRSGGGYQDENGQEYHWTSSDVQYFELVNGIPFRSNTVSVSVDQYGHVVGYNKSMPFDSSKLPKPDGIVSKEVATIGLSQAMEMNLQYQTRTRTENAKGENVFDDKPVLAYSPDSIQAIDAFTGKPKVTSYSIPELKRTNVKVTGANKKLIAKDKDAAAQVLSDLLQVDLSKLVFEEYRDTMNGGRERGETVTYSWHEDYSKGPTDGNDWQPMYVSASFDRNTGELQYAQRNGAGSKGASFTLEEGVAKALDIVKPYIPQGEQELRVTAYDIDKMIQPPSWYDAGKGKKRVVQDESRYSYTMNLMNQGVPIVDRIYSLDLNSKTGQLISLSLTPNQDVKLPDAKSAVDAEVAKANFIRNHPLQLSYTWDQYFDQQAPQGELVYSIDWRTFNFSYIDAQTGNEVPLKK